MNSNFESDSFIDVLLFFIRYRFRIIVGVVIGLMISLIIYLVFPVNSVPFVYSIHQKAQIRISAYMPSLQVQELMVDLPNNYMRAWILDPNRLVQTVFLVDKEIGAKLKEPNERMAYVKNLVDSGLVQYDLITGIATLEYYDKEKGAAILASSFESANKESKSKIRELNLLLKSVNEPGKKSIDLAQNILLVEMLKMSNDSFEPLAIVERKYDIVKTDKRIMICAVLIALIVFTVIMTTLFVNYIDNIKRNEEMTNKFKAAWGKK